MNVGRLAVNLSPSSEIFRAAYSWSARTSIMLAIVGTTMVAVGGGGESTGGSGVGVGDNTQRQTSRRISSGALAGVRAHGGQLYQQQRSRPRAPARVTPTPAPHLTMLRTRSHTHNRITRLLLQLAAAAPEEKGRVVDGQVKDDAVARARVAEALLRAIVA